MAALACQAKPVRTQVAEEKHDPTTLCPRSSVFQRGQKEKLITENPFCEMRDTSVKSNRERDYFVTHEEAAKVLAACPNSQWKLLFALSRYGGLRCPREHLAL